MAGLLHDLDVEITNADLNVHGLVGIIDYDVEERTESVFGVEASYLMPAGRTQVGPVVSVSRYTTGDGEDSYVVGGVFVNCNVTANIRGQVGWEGDLSIPEGYDHKESRFTAVADVAF